MELLDQGNSIRLIKNHISQGAIPMKNNTVVNHSTGAKNNMVWLL